MLIPGVLAYDFCDDEITEDGVGLFGGLFLLFKAFEPLVFALCVRQFVFRQPDCVGEIGREVTLV